MRKRTIPLVLAVAAAAMLALPALAAAPKLTGTVGPGFTISMPKKPTKAGKYTLVVTDKSCIHNFHLRGLGVNVKTSVGDEGHEGVLDQARQGQVQVPL